MTVPWGVSLLGVAALGLLAPHKARIENNGSEEHPHAILGALRSLLTPRSAFVSRPSPMTRLNGYGRGKES